VRVCDLIHGRVRSLEVRPSLADDFGDAAPRGKQEVGLELGPDGEPVVRMGSDSWPVTGANQTDRRLLHQILHANTYRLCWVVQARPRKEAPNRLVIQVHEVPGRFPLDGEQKIGVTDDIVEKLRKRRKLLLSVEAVVNWLADKLLLPPRQSGGARRLLISGPAQGRPTVGAAFRIHGNGFAADVAAGANEVLKVTRVVSATSALTGDERTPLYFAAGQVSFCDVTEAGKLRGVARSTLEVLGAREESYLKLWQQYNALEERYILRRARRLGALRYTRREPTPDGKGFEFTLTEKAGEAVRANQHVLPNLELQAGTKVPAVILDQDKNLDAPVSSRGRPPYLGTVDGFVARPATLTLVSQPDQDTKIPPVHGYLHVCLVGDAMRLQRRQQAWQLVRAGECPISQLGVLLEGGQILQRRPPPIKPLSAAALAAFPGQPTPTQRRALKRALNTPDIALIQGPPGTGKTRVVAALMARFADKDLDEEVGRTGGSGLLTSFQHDAVETAASATRVLGMPAVKVGKRRGEPSSVDGVELWRVETLARAQQARQERGEGTPDPLYASFLELKALAVGFLRSPAAAEDIDRLLNRALDLAGPYLPSELLVSAESLGAGIGRAGHQEPSSEQEERDFALLAVDTLRTEEQDFGEDGPRAAHRALSRLSRLEGFDLDDATRRTLEAAVAVAPGATPAPEQLRRLAAARDRLREQLQGMASTSDASPDAAPRVSDLLCEMISVLGSKVAASRQGVDLAVETWITDLENDHLGVARVVRHYTKVLAATCQQAVSGAMAEAKGEDTLFRNVIVDEAARVNPMDLFIPMSRAERRIILVGDHRQLPHMLEPEVERELKQSVEEETAEALQRSLFRRLFQELRRREAADGFKRTVTLDVQYRMHPILGDFVSKQFYEQEGEAFRPGLPAEKFAHDVRLADGTALADKVACWLDVPLGQGGEEGGRSKRRPAEARRAAREAAAMVKRDRQVSVGVITFYQGQRKAIMAALEQEGLAHLDDEGDLQISQRYRRTADGKRELLRVGTVDAFQGKEFDVVILSLVRSSKPKRGRLGGEAELRRRYGFLQLANRLCVALSRQQRLLVVVGDLEMTRGERAMAAVPHLVALRELCEGEHGTIL